MPGSIGRARSWEWMLSAIGIAAAALALASALYLSRSVDRALEDLQEENNSARVALLIQALKQNVDYLADFTTGYSMWDDTYEFLANRNDDYIEKNYSAGIIEVTPVQLVGIYDLSRELVLGVAYDEDFEPIALPSELSAALEGVAIEELQKAGDYAGRIAWMGDSAYVFVICPITDSGGNAPITGYLLFGSVIGERFLERLRNLTGLPLELSRTGGPLDADEVIATRQLGEAGIRIDRRSSNQWAAQVVFPGQGGSVVFETQLPSQEQETGRSLSRLVAVVALSVGATFAAFVALSVREGRRRSRVLQRKVAEQRGLLAARRKAEQMADRAAAADRAKSAFLAMMSHEIRTPLNAIVGYADLLREHPDDPELASKLEIIGTSGAVLRRILDDILDYSRIEAGQLLVEPEPVLIRKAVGSVVETFRHLADAKGNDLSVHIAEDVPACVLLDDARLRQVLGNLLSNAVKFTTGGNIMVSVARCAIEAAPNGNGEQPRAGLRIDVEDTGVGVSEEDEAKLFNPFVQVDSSATRRFEGTGLGLAICRRLCRLMGGEIRYRRREGGGSIFTVDVVAEPGTMPRDRRTETQLLRMPMEELSILVVDDHRVNTRLLTTILGRLGRTAFTADSGEAAIETFRQHRTDLVFMDVHMPGMGGVAAAAQIRGIERERGDAPCMIVAITADILIRDEIRAKSGLFDDFLGKPFTAEQISDILTAACLRRGTSRRKNAPSPASRG